jgi:predicted dehydrogenase
VAVIGVGSLGTHHARILAALPEARLVAVVDRDLARARDIGGRHGVAFFADYRQLDPGIEAVTVAVPTTEHPAVVSDCLTRGFAVLVEKPMAARVEEGEAMVAQAERSGRLLCVGHTERFNPAVRAVAARARHPRFIEAHRLGVFTARSTDVDVVLDLMIHDLDVILSLVPAPLETVDAVGVQALTDKVDIANARLRFAGGCVANVTASRISTDRVRKLRIFEDDSYTSIDYAEQSVVAYALRRTGGRPEIVRDPIEVHPEEPLAVELRAFVRAVRGEAERCVTAREGLAALRAARQVVDQIARGR